MSGAASGAANEGKTAMPVWRPVMHVGKVALVVLLATASMPRFVHARFDPLDPLGQVRKKQIELSIEVAPGDWGGADVGEIELVLGSVAAVFLEHVRLARDDLKLRVVPRSGSPRVLYERGHDGQYVIQLTARDQRWFQYAYQFAHELCHIASNFERRVVGERAVEDNQWFEEALCETAALFTLKRLGVAWASNPPTRNWMGYGESFAAYAAYLLNEPHRQLAADQSLRDWYAEHGASLKDNPYQRRKNEVVASSLLPLFEQDPHAWRALAYLNPDAASAAKPFAEYLSDWYRACPDKTLPRRVMRHFGFDPDTREAAPAAAPAAALQSTRLGP